MDTVKTVSAFDIDGTLMRSPTLVATLRALSENGVFPDSAWADVQKSYQAWQRREGEFDEFVRGTVDSCLENIVGVDQKAHDAVVAMVIEREWEHTHVYTRNLVGKLKHMGHFLLAISAAPAHITEPLAKLHGFDMAIGSIYEVENGKYTGASRYGWEKSKGEKLVEIASQDGLTLDDSYGVGDTEMDADMLREVDHPVAFNPSGRLLELAQTEGWQVVVERKNVAYSLTPSGIWQSLTY